MGYQLDRRSGLPYAAQVEQQTMAQLVAGRLRAGDRLPSVRQFARDLHISRTTAERIHDGLCEAMVAEMRPRSGAYVSWPDGTEQTKETERAHELYAFVKGTLARAKRLGLDATRLAALIGSLQDGTAKNAVSGPLVFSVVATQESYEMMTLCLGRHFPARLVLFSPAAGDHRVSRDGRRYLLSTYYMRSEGPQDRGDAPLLFVVRALQRETLERVDGDPSRRAPVLSRATRTMPKPPACFLRAPIRRCR